jgi:hypothetical protein
LKRVQSFDGVPISLVRAAQNDLREAGNQPLPLSEVLRRAYEEALPHLHIAGQVIMLESLAYYLGHLEQDFVPTLARARELKLTRRLDWRRQLLGNLRSSVTEETVNVEICAYRDSCTACEAIAARSSGGRTLRYQRFTIAEARRQQLLPHPGCLTTVNGSPGFCRCRYKDT